jgi:hypothetical protein
MVCSAASSSKPSCVCSGTKKGRAVPVGVAKMLSYVQALRFLCLASHGVPPAAYCGRAWGACFV